MDNILQRIESVNLAAQQVKAVTPPVHLSPGTFVKVYLKNQSHPISVPSDYIKGTKLEKLCLTEEVIELNSIGHPPFAVFLAWAEKKDILPTLETGSNKIGSFLIELWLLKGFVNDSFGEVVRRGLRPFLLGHFGLSLFDMQGLNEIYKKPDSTYWEGLKLCVSDMIIKKQMLVFDKVAVDRTVTHMPLLASYMLLQLHRNPSFMETSKERIVKYLTEESKADTTRAASPQSDVAINGGSSQGSADDGEDAAFL